MGNLCSPFQAHKATSTCIPSFHRGKGRRRSRSLSSTGSECTHVHNNALKPNTKSDSFKNLLKRTEYIKSLFHNLQFAHQGFISQEVLGSLLATKLGIEDPGIHEYLYTHFDKDHNGTLDFAEFFAFIVAIASIHREFHEADHDGDASITPWEFKTVLENMEILLEDSTVELLIQLFDINCNRVLDYGEFAILYIFVVEAVKIFEVFQKTKVLEPRHLCKLIDDHSKEESAAQYFNAVACKYRHNFKLDEFVCEIARFRGKVDTKRRKHTHRNTHWHARFIRELDLNNDEPWHDEHFDPDNANILPPSASKVPKVKWFRPSQIHSNSSLFVDGIDGTDVIQGNLNDCWFLGALTVVAAVSQDTINDLFVAEDRARGYYRCKFYKEGKWRTVDVDDRLPCSEGEGGPTLYFASCHNKSEFWVPILEKAYAKLHGSYDALEHGDICEALKDLTGGATQTIHISSDISHIESQWRLLLSFTQEKCLMGCVINSNTREGNFRSGLLENHAYSILNCIEVDGVRFVLLRNPWGKIEWNADWSDKSELWTGTWKKKPFVKNYTFEDDGKFHMCFEDFVKHFNRLYVLRTPYGPPKQVFQGRWEGPNAMGCHENPYWYCNPRYAIKVPEPDTTILVNLSQFDLRKTYSLNLKKIRAQGDYEDIGMYLLKKDEENYKTMQCDGMAVNPDFTDTRDTSLEYTFKLPSTYILRPCTYHPNRESSYILSVYSNKPVEVEEIHQTKSQTINGIWNKGFISKDDALQCQRPRYLLTCHTDGNVDILFVPDVAKSTKIGLRIDEDSETISRCIDNRRSICVSRTVRKNVEYIIEPLILEATPTSMSFELLVFSDNISQFGIYCTPTCQQCSSCYEVFV